MKLLGKVIDDELRGYYRLCPEEAEDMWHLFHLIQRGDAVSSTAIRRVQRETSTGSSHSERRKMTLRLVLDKVRCDDACGRAGRALVVAALRRCARRSCFWRLIRRAVRLNLTLPKERCG